MATDFAKRSEIFSYLKVENEYHLMGAGITALDDSLNPVTEEEAFIMDNSSTTTVDGYNPSFAFTMRVSKTDPVAVFLRGLGKGLATGEAAQTTMVRFDGWEQDINRVAPAKEYNVAIAVDYTDNGEGMAKIEMSGTIYVQGDPVDGEFDIPTETFTALS